MREVCHARCASGISYARPLLLPAPFKARPSGDNARRPLPRRSLPIVAATDFHQSRLAASTEERREDLPTLASSLQVRLADRDDELEASSWLRARSFYAYPVERKFAGEVSQYIYHGGKTLGPYFLPYCQLILVTFY